MNVTRMISVMDETYDRLKNRKGDKSFSELFEEMLDEKNQRILRFAGIWKKKWSGVDTQKWLDEFRIKDQKAEEKRWKELQKHWKGK